MACIVKSSLSKNKSYTFGIKYEGASEGASVCYFYNNNKNILKLNSNYQNITCDDGYIFINRFENINVSTTITFIFSDNSSDYQSASRIYCGYGFTPTGISVVNLDAVSQHNSNKQIKNIIVEYLD